MTFKSEKIDRLFHYAFKLWQKIFSLYNRSDKYHFSTDWHSGNIPNWNQHFSQFRDQANLRILEIGAYEGRSAVWFLENIMNGDRSKLVCIDVFYAPYREQRFETNIKKTGKFSQVVKIKGRSEEILRERWF